MIKPVVLASGSEIRRRLLEACAVPVDIRPTRVDETAIREALVAEGAPPRDIADQLAEAKARKCSSNAAEGELIIGADQVLDLDGRILEKPSDPEDARHQLTLLSGKRHTLYSAAVIYEDHKPVWRHVGMATLHVRDLSSQFIGDYVERNWESIRSSVGCYKIEEQGPRLFIRIDGSHFVIQGLPLLEILSYLSLRGVITT